jgi:predicted Zn-dependent protease
VKENNCDNFPNQAVNKAAMRAASIAGQLISHTQGNPRMTSRGDIRARYLKVSERLADGKAGRGGHAERIT